MKHQWQYYSMLIPHKHQWLPCPEWAAKHMQNYYGNLIRKIYIG